MRLYYCKYSFVLILMFLFSSHSFGQKSRSVAQDIKVTAYVTDKTGTLTSSQLKDLETKLAAFEKETSNQIVVWMEPSLDGNSVEDRSYEIAEKNGIGQKGKNNGILLYIAKNDRKLRIEVGYGLEGALTDALSSQIIRNEITPQFKKGNFYGGISAGVDAIMKATKGEYTADEKTKSGEDTSSYTSIGVIIVFAIIFFVVFGMPILIRVLGWKGSSNSWNWKSGGWSSGSGSGWSSGSGSSWSGGGFSGGGGSFGGGGSSGSW